MSGRIYRGWRRLLTSVIWRLLGDWRWWCMDAHVWTSQPINHRQPEKARLTQSLSNIYMQSRFIQLSQQLAICAAFLDRDTSFFLLDYHFYRIIEECSKGQFPPQEAQHIQFGGDVLHVLYTLRKPRAPLILNGKRGPLRVNRVSM